MVLKKAHLLLTGKVLIGTMYLLVAGEVFLRVFAPQLMLPRYVCPTEHGIRGNVPSQSYWHKAPEYRINIRINSKGLRADREIPYEKPPHVKRVLLLGDSFGMGYGVNIEDMFLTYLVTSLDAADVRCEAVNLSVSGFGTAEELVALQCEGLRYRPDLVVVAWHYTDLEDNVRSNLYAVENGRLVRRSQTYLPAVKMRQLFFRLDVSRWLAVHSHLYCCLRERAAQTVKLKVLPAMLRLTQLRPQASEPDGKEPGRQDDYPARLAITLLEEMQRQCRENGADLLVLDIPSRNSRTEFYSMFPAHLWSGPTQFHIYNPMADFKQHYGEKLYWEKEHGHFTPLGCKVVGEGLARTIRESGLLEGDEREHTDH